VSGWSKVPRTAEDATQGGTTPGHAQKFIMKKNQKSAAIGFIFITMLIDITGWGIIIPVILVKPQNTAAGWDLRMRLLNLFLRH
jgi:hypothetical protein